MMAVYARFAILTATVHPATAERATALSHVFAAAGKLLQGM
jgi:hypothetical protein